MRPVGKPSNSTLFLRRSFGYCNLSSKVRSSVVEKWTTLEASASAARDQNRTGPGSGSKTHPTQRKAELDPGIACGENRWISIPDHFLTATDQCSRVDS